MRLQAAHSSSLLNSGNSYLVAWGGAPQKLPPVDDGVITIRVNVKPFVTAVQGQLAAIADAAIFFTGAVATAGNTAAAVSGKVAMDAIAEARKSAGELEGLIRANPNEAAAVGVTLAAVLALKALLGKEEEEIVLPPSILDKIKAAATSSSASLGAAVTSIGDAAKALLVLPSASGIKACTNPKP